MKLLITESQIKKIVDEEMELSELRKSYMDYVVTKTKEVTGQDWPYYVLNDWLYKETKEFNPKLDTNRSYQKLIEDKLKLFLKKFGEGEWDLKTIRINDKVFTDRTRERLDLRSNSDENPLNVPNDEERFDTQQSLLQKTNTPSDEPIIVVETPNGLELIEGWHRTITYLKEFGEYEQKAYVYVTQNITVPQ